MKVTTIHTGYFKLDGGAMFGVVPKSIWQGLNPPDEKNLCTWSMRCLLVETGGHRILIDCGMGNKQSEKFFSYYEPHGHQTLEGSLNQAGYKPADITDVFLTHLHFDHCGGAVRYNEQQKLEPAFPQARYWSTEKHWEWAIKPNAREKASFLKDNIQPLKDSGHLHFVNEEDEELFPGFKTLFVYGHTEAMMLPMVEVDGRTLVFMADLIPSVAHIPLPYIMAYDIRPLVSLREKEDFLREAVEKKYILFFEHDRENECCTVELTERGFRAGPAFNLSSLNTKV